MSNSFTPDTTIEINDKIQAFEEEAWFSRMQQEQQEINQWQREEQERLLAETNQFSQQPANPQNLVKVNLLDMLELVTHNIKALPPEEYLEARSQLLQTLKLCQKLLEKHEERTFLPLLKEQQTDTLRYGKYEVSYKVSEKRGIDERKLRAALLDPEHIKLFLKPQEFKPIVECRELLFKLGIYSDVYTTKQGKKPILHITDTNTIKTKLEEVEN
jgi:hypothetical protein